MTGQPITEPLPGNVAAPRPVAAPNAGRRSLLDDPRVLGWGSVALVLVVWELTAILTGVNRLYLPRPTQIVVALVDMFANGRLAVDLGATLSRVFGGFFIELAIGITLGLIIASSERVRAIAVIFIAALSPLTKVMLIIHL